MLLGFPCMVQTDGIVLLGQNWWRIPKLHYSKSPPLVQISFPFKLIYTSFVVG